MQGRRIAVPVEATQFTFQPSVILTDPGDYCGPIVIPEWYTNKPMVWFNLPTCDQSKFTSMMKQAYLGPRLVTSPPHTFTEEPDGTLTITASILSHGWQEDDGTVPELWHGYLTKGVWSQC